MSVTQLWQTCGSAEFSAACAASTGVIAARGELDAANADQLAEYVQRYVQQCKSLTLDLSGLKFIGTAGFSALHRINVACSAAGTRWAMVPSSMVERLLRLCDPDGALPTMESANESAESLLLQLIPQPC